MVWWLADSPLASASARRAYSGWCLVAQRAVRALIVVFRAPRFKDNLRIEQAAEEFPAQTLVTQLVVEALDVGVLPRPCPA